MKTQEAIKWIFDIWHQWENIYGVDADAVMASGKEMDEVIELLKQGEKYKNSHIELVKEIEKRQTIINKLSKYKDMWYDNKSYSKSKKIEELEQKYFPEGDKSK